MADEPVSNSNGRWTCLECTWENEAEALICDGCDCLRGAGLVSQSLRETDKAETPEEMEEAKDHSTLLSRQTEGEFQAWKHTQITPYAQQWSNSDDAISVISPTSTDRCHFHPFLYSCFCRQTHRPRELIVIDTGDMHSSPSPFFVAGPPADDPRVLYKHFRTAKPWSIGAKRNIACHFSRGNVIVHFDDDDVYAPNYLSLMMSVLRSGQSNLQTLEIDVYLHQEDVTRKRPQPDFVADAATLQKWFTFGFRDPLHPPRWGIFHADLETERNYVMGYGFSFAYLRSVWSQDPFENINLGEDTRFFEGLLARSGCIALVSDDVGVCAHTNHESNFSGWEFSHVISQTLVSKELVNTARKLEIELKAPTPVSACTHLCLEECIAGFAECIRAFSSQECQAELREAARTAPDAQEYQIKLRPISVKYQAPLLPKYGFQASLGGILEWWRAWCSSSLLQEDEESLIFVYNLVLHWVTHPQSQQQPLREYLDVWFRPGMILPHLERCNGFDAEPGSEFRKKLFTKIVDVMLSFEIDIHPDYLKGPAYTQTNTPSVATLEETTQLLDIPGFTLEWSAAHLLDMSQKEVETRGFIIDVQTLKLALEQHAHLNVEDYFPAAADEE